MDSELREIPVADIFPGNIGKKYEHLLNTLSDRLVRASSSFLICEKINRFPTDMSLQRNTGEQFLSLFVDNAVYRIITEIHGMFRDKNKKCLTFISLREWMTENCCQMYSDLIDGIAIEPEDEVEQALLHKATLFRHQLAAHINLRRATIKKEREKAIPTFEELKRLIDLGQKHFRYFLVGHGRSFYYMQYDSSVAYPSGMDNRSDIEYILDLLAKNSALLNMPEEQPEFFPAFVRQNFDTEKKKTFNKWRKRIRLAEIDFERY